MTYPLLLILAIGLLAPGCQGYKPRLSPSMPELLINEGERLEITCTSIGEIDIYYPETDDNVGILTSEHKIIHENDGDGIFKTRLVRNETVFGDTGWYGCVDSKTDVPDERSYDDPNASWLYVYVKSNTSAFVTNELQGILGVIGGSVILPCRPTFPDLRVSLSKGDMSGEEFESAHFNPKEGFRLENLSAFDAGTYECKVEQGNYYDSVTYILHVNKEFTPRSLHISKKGLDYVTTGSSLHVNCSVQIGVDHSPYDFYWETPRDSKTSKTLKPVAKQISHDYKLVTSEYVEDNVTFDDEGEYTCHVKTTSEDLKTSQYIRVHDSKNKSINLTSHDTYRYYKIHERQSVTFSAYFAGNPKPTLMWEGPDRKQVEPDNRRFVIESGESTSTLKINTVSLTDTGTYTLVATNDAKEERLNFTLVVQGKPLVYVETNPKRYYTLNRREKFACKINSNPSPNVTWFYKKCTDMITKDDCVTYEVKEHVEQSNEAQTVTEIETTIDMCGSINCTACNTFGCNSDEIYIFVSDGVPDSPFGIVVPKEKVTTGDDITITCAASVYNYSEVEWVHKDTPISNSEKFSITFKDTIFSHQTNLTILNLSKEDERDYECRARTADSYGNYGDYETTQYKLKLQEPRKPEIVNSNLNNTEITKSTEEAHNLRLSCYAEGMPKPRVTWLLNNEPLKLSTKQYKLYNDNQTIRFFYLMESDSGKYSCLVQNTFGKALRHQNIVIKGSERILRIFFATIVGLVFAVVIILVCCCVKVRREQRMRKQLIEAGLMHFEEGAPECLNPDLTVDDQADLLPYDRKWEFPREKLKLGKQLGSGAFGVVMKGQAYGIIAEEPVTTVAVKMVRRNAENSYIRALASELKIMVHLGKHLNVVNLLGACTNNIAKKELYVIVEYCRFGNLHNYLLRHRESFIDQIDPGTGEIDPSIGSEMLLRPTSVGSSKRVKYAALSFSRSLSPSSVNTGTETVMYTTDPEALTGIHDDHEINSNDSQPGWRSNYRGDYKDRNLKPICTQDLLSWAFQVARGMEYLSKRKVLHGDLAARNILLAENNVVKICDFGLAKTMYKDDNYQKKGEGPVPIKWMAIESIRDRLFSTQSDIWSFGIVLWEFFTLAETPYPGMQAEMQYQRLIEGYRMEQPKYATRDIYEIMRQCWKAKPALRPSFIDLVEDIGTLLEENVKKLYEDLNTPYVIMNTADQEGKDDYLTMMSSPDHEAMSSPHDYVNDPVGDHPGYLTIIGDGPAEGTKIFSPTRPKSTPESRFQFPRTDTTANGANSDGEDVRSPMLKAIPRETDLDDDNYLKPIDVKKKRENFMKQQEIMKQVEKQLSSQSLADRDSGYCNTPKGLELIEIRVECEKNRNENWTDAEDETDLSPLTFVSTRQDGYINLPKQTSEVNKEGTKPGSFMNPSYIFVESSKSDREKV